MIKIKTLKLSFKYSDSIGTTQISKNALVNIVLMLVFCIGAVKNGFIGFEFNVSYQLLTALAVFVIAVRRIGKQSISYVRELFPFLVVFIGEIPLQLILGKEYYSVLNAIFGLIVYILMVSVVIIIINNKNPHTIWKVLNSVVLISSFLIIVQGITYVFGIRLDDIPNLSLFFNGWKFQFYRPCGPFSEPSHFAELGLLSLFYYLHVDHHIKKATIILASLFISTSTLGIVGGLIIVAMYIFSLGFLKEVKKTLRVFIYILAVISVIVLFIWINTTDNLVVDRILSGGSSSVRIMRSFELFNELKIEHKIFGIGIQNQELYLNAFNIILPSDNVETISRNREFAQTSGYLLCCTGIVGLTAFWFPLISRTIRDDFRLKSFMLLFGVVCFTCCIFSRTVFLIYLISYFTLKDMIHGNSGSPRNIGEKTEQSRMDTGDKRR